MVVFFFSFIYSTIYLFCFFIRSFSHFLCLRHGIMYIFFDTYIYLFIFILFYFGFLFIFFGFVIFPHLYPRAYVMLYKKVFR